MITTERLKQLFDYCSSGNLIRKIGVCNFVKVGQPVGFTDRLGYKYAMVDGKTYPLHRLIWAWHGKDCAEELDHINRQRGDNRIENLRAATVCENRWNKSIQRNNTSGVKGVSWKQDKMAYSVRIGVNKKRIHIGYFKDFELAELIAGEAREKYHGAFASHI